MLIVIGFVPTQQWQWMKYQVNKWQPSSLERECHQYTKAITTPFTSWKHISYCWWKKSCTSRCSRYPIIYKVLYIPGGAGFLPTTVYLIHIFWQIQSTVSIWTFLGKKKLRLRHWWHILPHTSPCACSRFLRSILDCWRLSELVELTWY